MTGFNMFNQTPTTASPFTATTLNTTSAFAAPQAQQTVSFGDPSTATTQSGFSFGGGGLQSGSLPQPQAKNVFARVGGFGSSPAATPTFGTAAPTMTGFAFPGAGTPQTSGFNPAPATSQTGGLFSSAAATSQTSPFAPTPATSQTGSIFASAAATPQTGSMFAPAAATPQTGSIFAPTAATPQTGSIFAPAVATSQTGLSFAPTPVTSLTGTFAIPSATPQQGLPFGAPAAAPQAGATFGSGSTLSQVSFGAPQASVAATPQTGLAFAAPSTMSQPGFGSGAPAAAPQAGATFGSGSTLSQVSFGAPQASVAATPQTGSIFAAPSATPQLGVLSAGAAAAPQIGATFGSGSALSQVSFGVPAASTAVTSQPGIAGGALTSATSTSLQTGLPTFAAPAATTTQVSQPQLGFGTTPSISLAPTPAATTTTAQGLTFGMPASTAQPTLSFGTGSTLATATTSTSALFPSSTTTATSSAFPTLGASSTTPASSAPPLFGNLTSTATTSTAAAPTGIFAMPTPATDSNATVSSATTSIGLGGVDHSAVATTQSAANTVTSVKEQPLPNEIQQTVLAFKEHVKLQKSLGSEVARMSSEPLVKLTKQINVIDNLIINLGSVLSQQKFTAEKMKLETIKALNDYELVQKIKDSPVSSEERLWSIQKYFLEKISSFEESTKTLQEKIEYVYQHVNTLPQENSLSAEALKLIVKKLHDSFVAIGARTYKLHNDMQLLKVQYMTIRNQYVKDKSPIPFSLHREVELPAETAAQSSELSLEGPSPFSRTGNGSLNSLLLMSQNKSAVASSSGSSVVGSILNTSRPLGFTDASGTSIFDQSSLPGTSQQFNLQKPPFGTKRGKR